MKKFIAIFIAIVIIIISALYGYFTYKQNSNSIIKENAEFEYYYNKEIYGADLATIINKIIDNNEKNNIEKDNKGKYIDDNKTSKKMDIKITDNNTIYDIETIYSGGIDRFVKNFNTVQFKCTDIKYHSNKKIKYVYFEQISN